MADVHAACDQSEATLEFIQSRRFRQPPSENILMPILEKYEVVVIDDPDDLIHWQ